MIPENEPRSRPALAAFLVLAIAVVGVFYYLGGSSSPCTGTVCESLPRPVIQSASSRVDSFSPSACEISATSAICRVFLNGGDHGVVSLNVSIGGQGAATGEPQVEFLVYSSASAYVTFTSIPLCAHLSAPSYEDRGCAIAGGGAETFHFSFTTTQTYGDATARWPDSITVVMWTTCCYA